MSSGLTSGMVLALMRAGVRQVDIADQYRVSRQYVNKLAKQGGRIPPVTVVTENMPWEVDSEYFANTVYQSVRLVGHWSVEPEALSGSSRQKVRAFLRKLVQFQQVVDFDPSYPAMPGLTNTPGFAYVPRTSEDEDFLIKIRPGVRITPLGNKIWRLPEEWP